MENLSEDELLDKLLEFVEIWKISQQHDGRLRPLTCSRYIDAYGVDMYAVDGTPNPRADPPIHRAQCPLSAIDDLILMDYFRRAEGTDTLTTIQPTTDALLLADASIREAFLATFHERYEQLHESRSEDT
jgi:hypothetical protein